MARSASQYDRDAMHEFVMSPVSRDMIRYLAKKACQVLRCENEMMASAHSARGQPPTPPESPSLDPMEPPIPSVENFIRNLVKRSHVEVPTLMTSLVFLARLQAKLPPMSKGMRCTPHRIFLASLILAAKNLNDSSPKNKHWSRYTVSEEHPGFGFSLQEVNLMERQLLGLLNWDTRVEEEDLFEHFRPFLTPIKERLRMEDKFEASLEREWQMQMSTSKRSHSRSISPHERVPSGGVYDSPMSIASSHASRSMRHVRRQSTHSSGRSISPPSLQDVPGLCYDTHMRDSTSRSSSIAPSSRGTPASFSAHSISDITIDDGKLSPSMSSGYITIQHSQPKAKFQVFPNYEHCPKRTKAAGVTVNGNLFSRFFNTAASTYAEKRSARAAARA